jgi:hypothetical protein
VFWMGGEENKIPFGWLDPDPQMGTKEKEMEF